MNDPRKSVFFNVLNQGEIRTELVQVLMAMRDQQEYYLGIDFPSTKPIANNRNQIVKRFLEETNYDYLAMVDDDIVPPINALNMLDHGVDVLAATCFAYRGNGILPLVLVEENVEGENERFSVLPTDDPTGLKQCDAVGTGLIFLSRRVLEDVEKPFENEYDEEGIRSTGLDLAFCRKAKKLGYKVHADLDYQCAHWATVDLKQMYDNMKDTWGWKSINPSKIAKV